MDLTDRASRMLIMVRKHAGIPDHTDVNSVYLFYKMLLGLPEHTEGIDAVWAMVDWMEATDWWDSDHYETMFLAYMAKRGLR